MQCSAEEGGMPKDQMLEVALQTARSEGADAWTAALFSLLQAACSEGACDECTT